MSIGIDSSNRVYVADTYNNRIQKFSSTGNFITSWDARIFNNEKNGYPLQVTIGSDDSVYVSFLAHNSTPDATWTNINTIQKFSPDGKFLTKLNMANDNDGVQHGPWALATTLNGIVLATDSSRYHGNYPYRNNVQISPNLYHTTMNGEGVAPIVENLSNQLGLQQIMLVTCMLQIPETIEYRFFAQQTRSILDGVLRVLVMANLTCLQELQLTMLVTCM